jgi:hypothetical protein
MVEPNQSLAAHFLTNLGQSLPWRRRWLTLSGASSTDDTLVMSEKSSSHSLIKTKNLTTARSVPEHSSNSVLVAATSTATPISTPETSDRIKHTDRHSSEDTQKRGTDKWFNGFVRLLQDERLRIWQNPGKPLRIAVLDSGIDFLDNEFNAED